MFIFFELFESQSWAYARVKIIGRKYIEKKRENEIF